MIGDWRYRAQTADGKVRDSGAALSLSMGGILKPGLGRMGFEQGRTANGCFSVDVRFAIAIAIAIEIEIEIEIVIVIVIVIGDAQGPDGGRQTVASPLM